MVQYLPFLTYPHGDGNFRVILSFKPMRLSKIDKWHGNGVWNSTPYNDKSRLQDSPTRGMLPIETWESPFFWLNKKGSFQFDCVDVNFRMSKIQFNIDPKLTTRGILSTMAPMINFGNYLFG